MITGNLLVFLLQAGESRNFPWWILLVLAGLIALGWFLVRADRTREDEIPPTGKPEGADVTVAQRTSEFESDEMEPRIEGGEGGATSAYIETPYPDPAPDDGGEEDRDAR